MSINTTIHQDSDNNAIHIVSSQNFDHAFLTPYNAMSIPDFMQLSKKVQDIQKQRNCTKNEIFVEVYKSAIAEKINVEQSTIIFKTFPMWKKEGYRVQKGAKHFKLWSGKKVKEGDADEKNAKFWCAKVFSNYQVLPSDQKPVLKDSKPPEEVKPVTTNESEELTPQDKFRVIEDKLKAIDCPPHLITAHAEYLVNQSEINNVNIHEIEVSI